MKNCPNCNYSLIEEKIIDIKQESQGSREIDCLRCAIPMCYTGNYEFHEGFNTGVFGGLFELMVNKERFELYLCPKCGKVEFFSPR